MSRTPSDADDTYWILRPDQLRAAVSARRMEIIDRLAASGPASVRELAAMIGAQPSALYHHIRQLLAVDLIREAGSRTVNRKREQLYATPSRRMRMIRALAEPANRAVMIEIGAALTRQMDRDFRHGFEAQGFETDGPGRNLGFFRLLGSPDAGTLAEINLKLAEIADMLWRSDQGQGPVVALSWIMAPVTGGGDDAGDGGG